MWAFAQEVARAHKKAPVRLHDLYAHLPETSAAHTPCVRPWQGPICVSLVGGGGKTTLAFKLAHEAAKDKKRVVVTTTTKMMVPAIGSPASGADCTHLVVTPKLASAVEITGTLTSIRKRTRYLIASCCSEATRPNPKANIWTRSQEPL